MDILVLIIYIVVFLYSVILHEIAHGWVANRFGDDTARISGRLSLNPLVHIDPFGSIIFPLLLYLSTGFAFGYAKPVPVNPYRLQGGKVAYRWVTLAGVLTNFSLAIISALVFKIATQVFDLGPNNLGVIFFQLALLLNLVLAVFNSLPLPGFDGFNFLTTFDIFGRFISKTPIGNPLFMVRYGLLVSLLILFLIWPFIGNIIYFFINLFSRIFGI
ncbi:MAG: hypothetical protein A3J62_01740 [Candidatus Buchananbacteria bacterium RIFCSPHIGHO2_02_FULL_38_8]|uniref:Peptidase M50 domain-containing protein n=2 Tax=Candidatus Buchananiibacteriota TaxID=1817903 RepID=A0A1G1XYI0_9BACT|nr:MAG: hypothetical protein A2731_00420 [Candidatus Buchananbacteria bacterium RIFCSPHIGHO2_01_FULL_39_8]OGY47314.1 MAG: hypothetical protein A3J62_01740 [Candidatus Buchananbacteria bacterium RIFCSPHIGHO2_02_FULL_38_8]